MHIAMAGRLRSACPDSSGVTAMSGQTPLWEVELHIRSIFDRTWFLPLRVNDVRGQD